MMRGTTWLGRTVGESKTRWARGGAAAGILIIIGAVIAAVTGTFSSAPAAHAAAVQGNPVSPEMLAAMTAGNSLHITTVPATSMQPQAATSQTTAEQSALRQLPAGSKVLGASLANAAIPLYGHQSQLVWLVSAHPAGHDQQPAPAPARKLLHRCDQRSQRQVADGISPPLTAAARPPQDPAILTKTAAGARPILAAAVLLAMAACDNHPIHQIPIPACACADLHDRRRASRFRIVRRPSAALLQHGRHPTEITCAGPCTKTWRPLPARNMPSGQLPPVNLEPGNVSSTTGRTAWQAEYNGHPLYTYAHDTPKRPPHGQGIDGKWFALTPAITSSSRTP